LPDRVSAANPNGTITNYRFEWGYLDIVLKIGLLGFLVYAAFIASIFRQGMKNFQFSIFHPSGDLPQGDNFQTLGILSGIIALLVLNITTPYLNHPLGVGFLILGFISFKRL